MATAWFLLAVTVYGTLSLGEGMTSLAEGMTSLAEGMTSLAEGMTSLPCPDPEDILPCVCTADDYDEMYMDCSEVLDEQQLAQVFSAAMPFNLFKSFQMRDNNNIQVLRDGVFGSARFRWFLMEYGSLVEVEEKALAGSYDILDYINLRDNQLSSFPFDTLKNFTALTDLHLRNNKLTHLPRLSSDSLTNLDLQHNPLVELHRFTVQELPNLQYCYFLWTNLTEVSKRTFMDLERLKVLYLSNNAIGHLVAHTIQVAEEGEVGLAGNGLTTIEVDAITAGPNGTVLRLEHNNLTTLDEAVFRPLFDVFHTIWLYDNPLTCGCDIAWLVTRPDYITTLDGREKCSNGDLLTDLDPSVYEDCPSLGGIEPPRDIE